MNVEQKLDKFDKELSTLKIAIKNIQEKIELSQMSKLTYIPNQEQRNEYDEFKELIEIKVKEIDQKVDSKCQVINYTLEQVRKSLIFKIEQQCSVLRKEMSQLLNKSDDQEQKIKIQILKKNDFEESTPIIVFDQQSNIKVHQNKDVVEAIESILNKLYNFSWKQRSTESQYKPFIRNSYSINELYKNYDIIKLSDKQYLAQQCNGFKDVRGDGNCFYTAFGFQYLQILLNKLSDQDYLEFKKLIQEKISFQIMLQKHNFMIDIQQQQLLKKEFISRLDYLKSDDKEKRENRLLQFYSCFEKQKDYLIDGCFYGLCTIFFRNLSNYVIENSNMQQLIFDKETLLEWEKECDSNEVVISELSKFLHIQVKLIFFQNQSFNMRIYGEEYNNIIVLLINPGHYNIGVI